jgi:Holliday junction DNA helicase RuvA
MIAFIKGKVFAISLNSIILENNDIGYRISIARPERLKKDEEVLIYTYQYVREDEISLFGFLNLDEYELFTKLISVKGIGPKTTLNILAKETVKDIVNAIELQDLKFIKSLPGIGAKSSSQIILDLKGKLVQQESIVAVINQELIDAKEGLKSLGYKANEINPIIKELSNNSNKTTDEYIKEALSMIFKTKRGIK